MITMLEERGEKYVLEIDKKTLKEMEIDPKKPIAVTAIGQVITLGAADTVERRKAFTAALEEMESRYDEALKELAK